MKRISCVLLVIIVSINLCNVKTVASASQSIDIIDSLLIMRYSIDIPEEDNFWSESINLNCQIPLYNGNKIVAWYVELNSEIYAVINNSSENPSLIEFGKGENVLIRDISNSSRNAKVFYYSPSEIFSTNQPERSLYDDYANLLCTNIELKNIIDSYSPELHRVSIQRNFSYDDDDFGFVNQTVLPSSGYTFGNIPYGSSNWVVMDDFPGAQNHCGATCATNIAIYYKNVECDNILLNNRSEDTFWYLYNYIGTGSPTINIRPGFDWYCSARGYVLSTNSISTYQAYKGAVLRGNPCAILVHGTGGILPYHWIMGIGWREYTSGNQYYRIVDGWYNSTLRYIMMGSSTSLIVSNTEYIVTEE